MGTLGKDGSNPLIFDGRPESWPPFKKALHQLLDKEGYGWVVEGGDVFCAMLQAASAKAAKSTVTSGKGTVSTNVADYQKKDLQTAFTNASVTTSVLLELIANRKTVLGAHHADHEKMGMTEEELAQAHAVLDAKRLTMVNRTVVRWLHDAVYPCASETPATIKLRSILKTPEVTKILQGEKLTTESLWAAQPWQIPAVHMYGRLAYKFEGMTDMINGAFMEDLSELLNSATGDQRRRKTFYEIDTEFEKMTASLLKNFNSMASLMPFLRASLRQTMIRKLASVGKDKDGWKKADEHLTTLMDQEHMITLEDTEAALKRCEQHLQRAATDDASPKAKVLATEISGQDTAAELAALKATTKAQDAKIKALSAQLRGDTSGAKRARNGVPVEKKPIPVCTVCSKRGHNAVDCWDKLDADQAKLDLAKAARDKKKADMSKRQPSSKETKAYTATVASNKALAAAAAASDSDYSTCHASLHGCVFDQEFVPHTPGTVLDSGAQVNILEGTLGSGTRIQLTGITGATTEAERADAMFPVLAADGSRHAISIRGKNIVATRTTDNILSLAVLLKAGYKVEFRVGTDLDPTDGGDLYTPKGKRIALVFSGNLWRLPMWSSPSRCESTAGIPAHQNPFAALLNIPENVACTRAASQPSEVSPLELSVADQIRLCHDRDGHPSYNTHLRMYKSREGRGYPANFPSLLAHFKCETCAVTLGARTYRTSKRVQDK
jgi:hypothetical protein